MVEFVIPHDEGEDKTVTPQTCLNALANTMKATAQGQTKGTIDSVVITCSHEFAQERRKHLM
jgi:molecular chaperone DnaK (HSP70)